MLTTLFVLAAGSAFRFDADFVEGCSCKDACSFEITGKIPGCQGAGFYVFRAGSFGGRSLAGGKVAFAAGPSGWVRLYYDGPTVAVRETARDFIVAALADWGKPERVAWAPITVAGLGGNYIAQVADGKILQLTTEASVPPFVHRGIFNRKLHPEIMQGRTLSCAFRDGKRKLGFAGTNGFFNPGVRVSGKL
ncbi:MAG: hypothetical protein ACAH95_10620 [Fimbriimonas sp.]